MTGRHAGSVLRSTPIRALILAEVVSLTGSQMTWLALPWFVLTTTGSATRTAVVVAAELIGLGLFTLPAGRLLHRLGARRTMLACDGARAPLLALIPALHVLDVLTFPLLLGIVVVLGAASAPYFSAGKVIVPELLGEDEHLITRASALLQSANRATFLLGPVLGGVLISVLSAPAVLLVDAATYLVALCLVAAFVPRTVRATPVDEDAGIAAGIRFLVREPLLRVWTLAISIGDAAWLAFFVTVPVLVVERFDADPRVAGWLIASFGVGALIGNGIAFRFFAGTDGLTLIGTFVLGQALPLWLLVGDFPVLAYSGALALSGIANGLVNPSLHALMTLRIPAALRPTAMSAMALVFVAVQPLGLLLAGPVLDALGPTPVLAGFAAVQTASMGAMAVSSLRARAREQAHVLPA